PGGHVSGNVLVDEVLGGARGLDSDHGRKEGVLHADPTDRVLGQIAVVGDDEGDRLADVVDLVLGQRELGAAVGELRVRDQQRQGLRHGPGEVVVGPDEVDALDVQDFRDVDVDDPGVRVRRAQHGGVQDVAAGQHVVDVAPV